MAYKLNPYRPGAGLQPVYLAGRDDMIEEVKQRFQGLKMNVPVSSVIYSGVRGVGKTVLLNKLNSLGDELGICCRHIEVGQSNDFISQIVVCMKSYLRENSNIEKIKTLADKAIDAIKTVAVSFNPEDPTFSLELKDIDLYRSNNLIQSLTDVFTSVGKIAFDIKKPICFFIDEIQYMKKEELGALIAALHRTNQLGYPIILIGAGLPKIYKMLSEEKSYSERMFAYRTMSGLTKEQTFKAITEPARAFGKNYTRKVLEAMYNITKGYPFFVQQLASLIYDNSETAVIDENNLNEVKEKYYTEIDNGFYKTRYERCSNKERIFIFAMVKSGKIPCEIGDVAENMNKTTKSVSPIRAQLINKGIIYSLRYKELDFTVPDFDGFIKRKEEYIAWSNSD